MKLETTYRKEAEKKPTGTNTWVLNNMLLNHQWIKEEIKWEIKNYLELMNMKAQLLQNLWDAAKAYLRWKFLPIEAYFKKQKESPINFTCKGPSKKNKTKQNPT